MLFKSRKTVTLWERIRLWLWPRRSFSRSLRYMGKRLLRIAGTPHAVAFGLAIGIFMACTPLFGLHIILAVVIAWFARANVASAAIGTAFSNPLTVPFIIGLDYLIGHFILDLVGLSPEGPIDQEITLSNLLEVWHGMSFVDAWEPILKPILIGAPIIGGLLGLLAYGVAYGATSRFQERRRAKLAEKTRLALAADHADDAR